MTVLARLIESRRSVVESSGSLNQPNVRNAADDWEPPRVRLELVAIRTGDHEHECVTLEMRVRREAVSRAELDRIRREPAGRQHQSEPRPCRGVRARVVDEPNDLAPPGENLGFLPPRPAQVTARGREQERDQGGEGYPSDAASDAATWFPGHGRRKIPIWTRSSTANGDRSPRENRTATADSLGCVFN